MSNKPESTARNISRSIAMGVLLSMVLFYGMHVLGAWKLENYRTNTQTTFTTLLHNKCLFFNDVHTLRPNTGITSIETGVDGNKLTGSFMNFFDGHITAMIIVALLFGLLIFIIRSRLSKNRN